MAKSGKYKFFPAADAKQDEIWQYTKENWGEAQADKYIRNLHGHLEKTALKKIPWHKLPAKQASPLLPKAEIFYTRYEKHYIFFRILPHGNIGIMSILHEAMDLPVRLNEDLEKLQSEIFS